MKSIMQSLKNIYSIFIEVPRESWALIRDVSLTLASQYLVALHVLGSACDLECRLCRHRIHISETHSGCSTTGQERELRWRSRKKHGWRIQCAEFQTLSRIDSIVLSTVLEHASSSKNKSKRAVSPKIFPWLLPLPATVFHSIWAAISYKGELILFPLRKKKNHLQIIMPSSHWVF